MQPVKEVFLVNHVDNNQTFYERILRGSTGQPATTVNRDIKTVALAIPIRGTTDSSRMPNAITTDIGPGVTINYVRANEILPLVAIWLDPELQRYKALVETPRTLSQAVYECVPEDDRIVNSGNPDANRVPPARIGTEKSNISHRYSKFKTSTREKLVQVIQTVQDGICREGNKPTGAEKLAAAAETEGLTAAAETESGTRHEAWLYLTLCGRGIASMYTFETPLTREEEQAYQGGMERLDAYRSASSQQFTKMFGAGDQQFTMLFTGSMKVGTILFKNHPDSVAK